MASQNLLIAAMPDLHAREILQKYRLLCRWPGNCRLNDPARLHMTLLALGQVDEGRVIQIRRILREQFLERSELMIRIPKGSGQVRSLQVRVPPGVQDFRAKLRGSLELEGLKARGGNSPHITLSYTATAERPAIAVPDIPWRMDQYVLIWSQMPPEFVRAQHLILETFTLSQPAQQRLFSEEF